MAQQRIGRIQWGGLTFGPGSRYHVTAIEGLDDMPDIRADDMERPGQHGDYTGPDRTGPRIIPIGLGLRADSPDELRDLTLTLRAATQPQDRPEPMLFLDQDTLVYGKIRRRSIPYDAEYLWCTGSAALELYCADPYLYGLEERSASTTAYSPAAGRTYPLTYAGVAPATNLVLNPSSEVDVITDQQMYGPSITRVRVTSDARYGDACVQHTHTAASSAGTTWTISPQTAGTVVQVGIWVKIPAAGITSGQITWRSGTTTLNNYVLPSLPAPGEWVRITGSYTIGAGQTCDRVGLAFNSAINTVWWADAAMAVAGMALPEYGDGSMTGYGWSWTGTPNDSTSVRTLTGTDRTYGSAGQSGRITAVNAGSSPAYPVLRLDGPIANPSIEQVNTGGGITIDATLAEGEYLLINTRTRAVLYMGSSPRRSWVRAGSTWPLLQPGHNELAYRGTALPGPPGQLSLLTVTWRDTSL
ncbi:phage distal tail protein [Streptomyces sp. or3]|uniref:phage distal tail protein n=1 Tax=Streptomyces sp. or3 TaxID=1828020 RepID=UPI000BFB46A0|nr:phage tail domain-containing protein [Streptomyces sp. or3]